CADVRFRATCAGSIVRLALAGTTILQIATFTGRSFKDVEAILDVHYLGRDVQPRFTEIRGNLSPDKYRSPLFLESLDPLPGIRRSGNRGQGLGLVLHLAFQRLVPDLQKQ